MVDSNPSVPPSSAERLRALASRPDAVLFTGDGEPESASTLAARLDRLAASGQIEFDDYSNGGAVARLEARWADLLGKEAAVWFPTGTLANHLAVRRIVQPRARVVVPAESHLFQDEGDALQRLSSLSVVALAPRRPCFSLEELRDAFDEAQRGRVPNPVGAVVIESPVRRQAGQVVPFEEMRALTALARDRGARTHLDGARLFMMSAATGVGVRDYAHLFDTVYVSLWKYLPAPFGGILAGPASLLEGMHHERRMFGGSLPSAALAAALAVDGMDGLEQRHVEVMRRAREFCGKLAEVSGVEVRPFTHGSNIVRLRFEGSLDAATVVSRLFQSGIHLPDHSEAWDGHLAAFNPTLLRRSVADLVAAFQAALAPSGAAIL